MSAEIEGNPVQETHDARISYRDLSGGSTSTNSDSDGGKDSDEVELLEESITAKTTRSKKAPGDELLTGLDEAKEEELKNRVTWWDQFVEEGNLDLENIELGSKMVLLMDILKETELLGDKVLVFSQSLLSLDLIEDFLQKIDAANHTSAAAVENSSLQSYLGTWQHGRDYFRMDGSTAPDKRKIWCNYFNKVFSLSCRGIWPVVHCLFVLLGFQQPDEAVPYFHEGGRSWDQLVRRESCHNIRRILESGTRRAVHIQSLQVRERLTIYCSCFNGKFNCLGSVKRNPCTSTASSRRAPWRRGFTIGRCPNSRCLPEWWTSTR